MFRQPRIFRSDVDPCKYRTLTKPAFSNFNAALRTAWKGVGDALTNFTNLLAAAGPAGELIAVIAEEEKARVMVDRRYICCNSKPCAESNFGLYGTALPGWNIKIDTRLPITLSRVPYILILIFELSFTGSHYWQCPLHQPFSNGSQLLEAWPYRGISHLTSSAYLY